MKRTSRMLLSLLLVFGGSLVSLPSSGGQQLAAAGSLEIAFSPNEGAEDLVVKLIDSARSEIRVMAYSFTSALYWPLKNAASLSASLRTKNLISRMAVADKRQRLLLVR
jgi:delta-aminolevulinic acid dehydratase/porphobilinogen synthase